MKATTAKNDEAAHDCSLRVTTCFSKMCPPEPVILMKNIAQIFSSWNSFQNMKYWDKNTGSDTKTQLTQMCSST